MRAVPSPCLALRLPAVLLVCGLVPSFGTTLRADTGAIVLQGARAPLIALPGSTGSTGRPVGSSGPAGSVGSAGSAWTDRSGGLADHGGAPRASLFAGDRNGLFQPVRQMAPAIVRSAHARQDVARLLDLIARAEAGSAGYDAVQYGARIKPPQRPTAMTLAQIEDWTVATPRQPHAIGRYQFIPVTLRRLVRAEGLPPSTRFSPQVQDRLAIRLLTEAGLDAFLDGGLSRGTFMNNLAKIWAGLPTASGRSHYHGYAGNKATMTRARFDREMQSIFGGPILP